LIAVPSVVAWLLLGVPFNAPAVLTIARVTGAGLLALGVACWLAHDDTQDRAARGLVSAMVLYNLGAVITLGAEGIRSQPIGFLLWPSVVLHTAMAVWCIASLMRKT
jgi:hypothetical protein